MNRLLDRAARLFHAGNVPDDVRAKLAREGGIDYLAEQVRETAVLRNVRTPGHFSAYRIMSFIGYVAISEKRLLVRAQIEHEIVIDLEFDDPRCKRVHLWTDGEMLCLAFDAGDFLVQASGEIELRLHLPDCAAAVEILNQRGLTLLEEATALG